MSQFWMGFETACLVGAVWYALRLLKHPKPRGSVGVVILKVESKEPVLVCSNMKIDADDPKYLDEIHITPDTEEEYSYSVLALGNHKFTRECFCHPEVRQVFGYTLILHR